MDQPKELWVEVGKPVDKVNVIGGQNEKQYTAYDRPMSGRIKYVKEEEKE